MSFCTLIVRLFFSWRYAFLKISDYLKRVLVPIFIVTIFAAPLPIYVAIGLMDDFRKLLLTFSVSVVSVIASVVLVGMTKQERKSTIRLIINKIIK